MNLIKQIKTLLLFSIVSSFILLSSNSYAQTGDGSTPCNAKPFCSDSSYNFPNNYGNSVPPVVGPAYGCLFSQPNQIWYWMQIGTAGTIQISIAQVNAANNGLDVDFAMWGPFADLATGCLAVINGQAPLQCSYSSSTTETIGLGMSGGVPANTPAAAIVGQVYIVVLTNYSNQQGSISFAQTAGTGSADCGIVCGLSATNSGNACLGENITLNAVTADTVNTFDYYWTGPNGYTSTGKVTSVLPTQAGTYTYSVMGIATATGDTCNASTQVVIYPTPSVAITNPQNRVLCNDPVSNIVLSNPSDSTSYQWYFNGVALAGDTGTTLGATQTGNYTVSGTSIHGCTDTSVVVNIAFRFTHSDFNFAINKGCSSDKVVFTNTGDNGSYIWNFGDGSPLDTTQNPVHIYNQQGIYTVRLKTTSSVGCVDSTIKIVNTNHPLQALFSLAPDSVCQTAMTPVVFSDASIGNIQQWEWNFGDGAFSTVQNPTHAYTLAGVHTIQLIITDDVPCRDTITHTVYVDSAYNFTVKADRTSICVGEEINFNIGNYVSNIKGIWSFGDGNSWVVDGSSTMHSYDRAGLYFPKLTVNFPICQSVVYNSDSILVHDFPKVDLGPDSSLCLNGSAIILQNQNANDPNATYKWSTGDTTYSLKVVHEGIYTLAVTTGTCTTKEQVTIVKDCYTDIPNAFTPNGDGENDYFYPRQLMSKGVIGFKMTIFNRWGQVVFKTDNPNGRGWDGKFNEKDQPSGVYVYQIVAVLKNGRIENYSGNVTLLR